MGADTLSTDSLDSLPSPSEQQERTHASIGTAARAMVRSVLSDLTNTDTALERQRETVAELEGELRRGKEREEAIVKKRELLSFKLDLVTECASSFGVSLSDDEGVREREQERERGSATEPCVSLAIPLTDILQPRGDATSKCVYELLTLPPSDPLASVFGHYTERATDDTLPPLMRMHSMLALLGVVTAMCYSPSAVADRERGREAGGESDSEETSEGEDEETPFTCLRSPPQSLETALMGCFETFNEQLTKADFPLDSDLVGALVGICRLSLVLAPVLEPLVSVLLLQTCEELLHCPPILESLTTLTYPSGPSLDPATHPSMPDLSPPSLKGVWGDSDLRASLPPVGLSLMDTLSPIYDAVQAQHSFRPIHALAQCIVSVCRPVSVCALDGLSILITPQTPAPGVQPSPSPYVQECLADPVLIKALCENMVSSAPHPCAVDTFWVVL
ncbi:hypothetical protein KIPB_009070, partial [Kipferlia bialata]|eukprot:g9070.t1